MSVEYVPPPLSTPDQSPVPYTANPLALCSYDVVLFLKCAWAIPGILRPWKSSGSKLDELYPSLPNLFALFLHGNLIVLELFWLLSLPFLTLLPIWTAALYTSVVFGLIWIMSTILNGQDNVLESKIHLRDDLEHPEECWIYLNGVSIGHHWLQSNIDRLTCTFRRPVIGVHNRTYGIVFDLIQCIIERNFNYATADTRRSYDKIKENLLKKHYKKVILILHSQGGIEGGLILDWLLAELPHDIINKLEIYTFGSAANHFNNPARDAKSQSTKHNTNAVRHIEHYADEDEFVARWGVLAFTNVENPTTTPFTDVPNRYMGQVFRRKGTGHLLNQHYLNAMFPLDENMRVLERNKFMDMEVSPLSNGTGGGVLAAYADGLLGNGNGAGGGPTAKDQQDGVKQWKWSQTEGFSPGRLKSGMRTVGELSRLWKYRNGRSPEESEGGM